MPSSSSKRVAALAVSRFGADPARVQRVWRDVARGRGTVANLLTLLVAEHLLTPAQADSLRSGLDVTRSVPDTPGNPEAGPAVYSGPDVELRNLGDFRILRR